MEQEQPKNEGPPKPDADGNYDSPALIALRKVWEDYCEELATDDDVLSVIHEIGAFAHHEIDILEGQLEDGTSDPENESFRSIFEGFEALLEACEIMLLEFAEEIPEDMEEPEDGFFVQGFDLVQEATNQMMKGHESAMAHIEEMAEVCCPFCQQSNPRGVSKCGKCGRALPMTGAPPPKSSLNVVEQQGLEQSEDQGVNTELTKNYAFTAHMLEEWKADKVTPEELSEFLDNLEQNFLTHRADTDELEQIITSAPVEQQAGLHEAMLMTREGLAMSLEAVAKMKLAFANEDDRYLFFGLSDLEEASKVMMEAYWANKKAAGKDVPD